MDIIAALHWLQENIGAFGGDPLRTTLAGHGTGSACVHFLITSSAVPEGELYFFYHNVLYKQRNESFHSIPYTVREVDKKKICLYTLDVSEYLV